MSRMMKESNNDWIGKIPQNWELQTIGSVFNVRNIKVSDKDFEPLSVTKIGVVKQLENVAKTDANDNRKLVLKNDFVINSRSDRKQSCGVSSFDGSVSLINTVLFKKDKVNILDEYPNYLLKNYGFAEEFYRWGHGIVADLWTTRWQEMKSIVLPIPGLEEQRFILDVVKNKTNKIDILIQNQEQQIEKLKEYKQSLITEVVTKGLDRNVVKKDTGVKEIGNIPENWELKRAKYIADFFSKGNGITKDQVFENGNIQCVRYGEIYSKYENQFDKTHSLTILSEINAPKYVHKGDILFAGTGELVEEIGKNIVYLGDDPCLAGGDIIVMSHSQNPKFLNYAFNSIYSQKQKSRGKAKLKVVHISATEIRNLLIVLPPILEQESIAKYLDEKCGRIDDLIRIKKKKIDNLNEYKKSLIYEYVTGKKEVQC